MPVHDWRRVDDGTFHAFHTAWITHLSEALNDGLLPEGYYALPEQHAGRRIADVLTLQAPPASRPGVAEQGGLAVADAPPKVRYKLSPPPSARAQQRTLAIRNTSGHRIVALVEIVSAGNKDRPTHVAEFVEKVTAALRHDIHVLIVDLFPPGSHDPRGMHGAIWEQFDDSPMEVPEDEPLTLASYVAEATPTAYVERLGFGAALAEMPLFLSSERYIDVPLEATYLAAFQGFPQFWRAAVSGE